MKKNNVIRLTDPFIISVQLVLILFVVSSRADMSNDEGMWSYIGRIWSQYNIPPYVGAIENKTPGIFMLYTVSYFLFGVNVFFVRGLGIISIILTSLIIFYIGKELHSHLAGILGMYIFGLTNTWMFLGALTPAQTETFMILFSTLSFYFVIKGKGCRRWRYWLLSAGVSMGFAITFKQIAITTALALLFFFLVNSGPNQTKLNKLSGVILIGLGICLSTFLGLLPLFLSGVTLKDYFINAWLILLNQGSSSTIIHHILGFFSVWRDSKMVVFYPFFLLLIFQKNIIKNKFFIGLLVWLLFDFIGVNSSGNYYGHQIKQLIPSLSIIIGVLVGNLITNFNNSNDVYHKYVTTAIIVIILSSLPYQIILENIHRLVIKHPNPYKEIGTWLRDNTSNKDYVYVMGSYGNPILSYSERVSSSKYFNSIYVTTDSEKKILLSELKEKPPLYIVKPPSTTILSELDKIENGVINSFMSNYIFFCSKYGWNIYKWK